MKEQLISLKTAKLAKEKGFYIPWLKNHFNISENKQHGMEVEGGELYEYTDNNHVGLSAQSLLQKWLRDIHNIQIWFSDWYLNEYGIKVTINGITQHQSVKPFNSYEEALEKALYEGLKLIKN